jgi:hypothetical protein
MSLPACPAKRAPLSPLTNSRHASHRTAILMIALALGVLVAALLGPAQTLAQTHKAACHASHTKTAHTCAQSKGKHKPHHASKSTDTKHKSAKSKKTKKGSAKPVILVPALCEDGSQPTRVGSDSFSCEDGSVPSCEGGATPTTSHNGKALLCPVSGEQETSAAEGEGECEEEEEALSCSPVSESGSGEKVCEISPSAGASAACEGEH